MSLTVIFGELIGAVTGLYVANSIPQWNIPIITSEYLQYLPYLNFVIVSTCVVRILMDVSPWFSLRMIFEGMSQLLMMFALYMLIVIFPFDFTAINRPQINEVLTIGVYAALALLFISFLTTLFRLIRGR